jgi:hypothetical protein
MIAGVDQPIENPFSSDPVRKQGIPVVRQPVREADPGLVLIASAHPVIEVCALLGSSLPESAVIDDEPGGMEINP